MQKQKANKRRANQTITHKKTTNTKAGDDNQPQTSLKTQQHASNKTNKASKARESKSKQEQARASERKREQQKHNAATRNKQDKKQSTTKQIQKQANPARASRTHGKQCKQGKQTSKCNENIQK